MPLLPVPDMLETVRPSQDQSRRRRARSIAIALMLGGLVVLFYVVTIVRVGPGILERPL